MSSADELLAKVKKAAKHPKALLFGALAAECPSPTQTASKARKEHGLSNEEEKLTKGVAVLKRDSKHQFGKSYLEVLAEVIEKLEKPKERKMNNQWIIIIEHDVGKFTEVVCCQNEKQVEEVKKLIKEHPAARVLEVEYPPLTEPDAILVFKVKDVEVDYKHSEVDVATNINTGIGAFKEMYIEGCYWLYAFSFDEFLKAWYKTDNKYKEYKRLK